MKLNHEISVTFTKEMKDSIKKKADELNMKKVPFCRSAILTIIQMMNDPTKELLIIPQRNIFLFKKNGEKHED